MQVLLDVLQNYPATKSALNGKAVKTEKGKYPDHLSLTSTLPELFESVLRKRGRLDEFKVEGSYGAGVIAAVPWVGVFNRRITESAQNGFYIVLLFSEDMESCVLSLNQGVTAFEEQFSRKVARIKIKDAAARALHHLSPPPSAILGPIDLKAQGHLGKGYERGAIVSFLYHKAALPSQDKLEADFVALLSGYDNLVSLGAKTLETLAPVSEAQYQQAALERAATAAIAEPTANYAVESPTPIPPKGTSPVGGVYQRNPTVAARALERAAYKCEIDPSHKTFISSAKNLPYVEAHHLIPMSQQGSFTVSLDVASNVVCLCPLCHKLLHHGKHQEKRQHIVVLLEARRGRLRVQGIEVDEKKLLRYYRGDLLEEDS